MIVPYKKFKGVKSITFRPAIVAKLIFKNRSVQTWGLLDSGADRTLINKDIGQQLGIDFDNCRERKMTGIYGQPQPTWDTTIQLKVNGFDDVIFQADVSLIDSRNVGVLFGHTGFFEFFDVKLQTLRQQFEIELAVSPPRGINAF